MNGSSTASVDLPSQMDLSLTDVSIRKLKILFVDDDPAILGVLPRLLAAMKHLWEMEFATGAQKGLELAQESSFDVVLSDWKMEKMNGVEFLKIIRDQCPLAIRVIFSSFSDKHSILDCAGLVHQFLPKPFDRETLISTIERATLTKSLLPASEIRQKISQMEGIPSVPRLYQELVNHLGSSANSIEDIAETVSKDIGMTVQILKMVNSAYFGLSEPTSNITKAVSHLGVDTVKYLALAAGVFSQFESRKLGGISIDVVWGHSTLTASAAKHIAKTETGDQRTIDDAAAAGLLHDIGKLVLAASFPDRYETVGRLAHLKRVEWIIEERRAFGFDHAEVGGYLLTLWGLPSSVVDAVTFHHYPNQVKPSTFSALTAVHAANVLVQTRRIKHGGIAPPQIDHLHIAKTCRPNALHRWRSDLEEVASI